MPITDSKQAERIATIKEILKSFQRIEHHYEVAMSMAIELPDSLLETQLLRNVEEFRQIREEYESLVSTTVEELGREQNV